MHGALIRFSGATGLAFSRCSWNRPAHFPSGLSANSKTCSTRQARIASPPRSAYSRSLGHMYSGVIVRCILAASTLEAGKAAVNPLWRRWPRIGRNSKFDRHCSGPNLDATPNDIIRRIERYSGVKLARPSRSPISTARSSGTANMPTRMAFTSRRLSWSTAGPARHEQWRPNRRLGGAPIGSSTPSLVQEARSAIAWPYRIFAERGNQTSPSGKNLPPLMPVPNLPLGPRPEFEQKDCGGAAPA
jgi:hypothetical protein